MCPAYQAEQKGARTTGRRGGHSARLLFGHEEDIATTTKAKATALLPFFFVLLCVSCSPRNNNCTTKKDNGHTNNIKPAKSAKGKTTHKPTVDAGQEPPGQDLAQDHTIKQSYRLDRQAKGHHQQQQQQQQTVLKVKALHRAMTMTMYSTPARSPTAAWPRMPAVCDTKLALGKDLR